MAVNRGKQFENVIKEAFERVPDVSVVRLHDQTTGYIGSSNHCDFIVYHKPYEYHLECKSVHGNTFSIHSNPKKDKNGILHGFYGNITDKQWEGLLEKSKIPGVIAGVIVWWVDKDVTLFIPIGMLQCLRNDYGYKSFPYHLRSIEIPRYNGVFWVADEIQGKKKRVFFDYDMQRFLEVVEYGQRTREENSTTEG